MMSAEETVALALKRIAREGERAITSSLPEGSPAHHAVDVATGLIYLIAEQLSAGKTVEEITAKLHSAPSLREGIAKDREDEDAAIGRKPRREP